MTKLGVQALWVLSKAVLALAHGVVASVDAAELGALSAAIE